VNTGLHEQALVVECLLLLFSHIKAPQTTELSVSRRSCSAAGEGSQCPLCRPLVPADRVGPQAALSVRWTPVT